MCSLGPRPMPPAFTQGQTYQRTMIRARSLTPLPEQRCSDKNLNRRRETFGSSSLPWVTSSHPADGTGLHVQIPWLPQTELVIAVHISIKFHFGGGGKLGKVFTTFLPFSGLSSCECVQKLQSIHSAWKHSWPTLAAPICSLRNFSSGVIRTSPAFSIWWDKGTDYHHLSSIVYSHLLGY